MLAPPQVVPKFESQRKLLQRIFFEMGRSGGEGSTVEFQYEKQMRDYLVKYHMQEILELLAQADDTLHYSIVVE
jgi:hypothetical protein